MEYLFNVKTYALIAVQATYLQVFLSIQVNMLETNTLIF